MTTRQKKIAWSTIITVAIIAAGLIASFVRVQVHAEDNTRHLTRETLQREYVPRQELDHRLDAQMEVLKDIREDVKEIRRQGD